MKETYIERDVNSLLVNRGDMVDGEGFYKPEGL